MSRHELASTCSGCDGLRNSEMPSRTNEQPAGGYDVCGVNVALSHVMCHVFMDSELPDNGPYCRRDICLHHVTNSGTMN